MTASDRIVIRPATLRDLSWVAAFMRPADRREVFALGPDDNPLALAARIDAMPGEAHAACRDGAPVAVFGAAPNGPGVVEVWMFATPAWPGVAAAVTRYILGRMLPGLAAAGIRRAQCLSIEGHVEAHRWLERLGAVREGVHPGRGRGGETFITYAWRRGDPLVERLLDPARRRPHHPFQPDEKGDLPMCVGPFSPPSPPPPPPLPTYDDSEQQRLEAEERRRLRNAKGRDSTILTLKGEQQQDDDDGRQVSRTKNLLGE